MPLKLLRHSNNSSIFSILSFTLRFTYQLSERCSFGDHLTAWKLSKYGVFSGSYFPAFRMNTERYEISNEGKYGPEKAPYLDTFHTVSSSVLMKSFTEKPETKEESLLANSSSWFLRLVVRITNRFVFKCLNSFQREKRMHWEIYPLNPEQI